MRKNKHSFRSLIAFLVTWAFLLLSVFNLPPASWVIQLNGWVKSAWVVSPELEPPFGYAEEVSLAGLARRMDLDLPQVLKALQEQGIAFDSQRDSLEQIARENDTTPMALYGLIRPYEKAAQPATSERLTREALEARYAGTGLGRKPLAELCQSVGIELRQGWPGWKPPVSRPGPKSPPGKWPTGTLSVPSICC